MLGMGPFFIGWLRHQPRRGHGDPDRLFDQRLLARHGGGRATLQLTSTLRSTPFESSIPLDNRRPYQL